MKLMRLLFTRQEKLVCTCAAILTLSVQDHMDEDGAVAALKAATVAWYDAESKEAVVCMNIAGIDPNIGDLDTHGAFNDGVFRKTLLERGAAFVRLEFIDFDAALAFDMGLFAPEDEEVPA